MPCGWRQRRWAWLARWQLVFGLGHSLRAILQEVALWAAIGLRRQQQRQQHLVRWWRQVGWQRRWWQCRG